MPYVIITYDVKNERQKRLHSFLKGYLYWSQNSVFEGNLSVSDLELVKQKISEIIDHDSDSVFIYLAATHKNIKKTIIGIEKKPLSLTL